MGRAQTTNEPDERAITRLAMAHDASPFLLMPSGVVTPESVEDVAALMVQAVKARQAITFRAGGTSLCGQAVTAGLLVDVRRHFRSIEVLDDGLRVRAGAGATLRAVNARLARHDRRLGPDPTSDVACTVGGIIANNSSGMLSGVTQNSYHTLESMVFVLPSGRIVDTSDPTADITLRLEETPLVGGLHMLRKRLRTTPSSIADINRLFAMKNTMGYGLNALLEFHRPVDLIRHLLIGSEGTLGFVAEATFRTVPLAPHAAAALALFPTLDAATAAVEGLVEHGFEAIELMDAASLRVARTQPGAPALLRDRELSTEAALLVELHEVDEQVLAARLDAAAAELSGLDVVGSVELTTEVRHRNALVELRRGLYALVAGARPSGSTTLLEDICVPPSEFAATCRDLADLLHRSGYADAPLFAHARDGNIHVLLSERFDDPAGLLRHRKFTRQMVRLTLRHHGVLKAEHGTGRAMAPFLREQYGDELYEVMREIKHLFDPSGVLNPGVLISDDPDAHLKDLKLMPTIEPEVDACIECGFCEPVCPSRDLTLTPRQRIVLRREMAARKDDTELLSQVAEEYDYAAIETCAVDGMCAVVCPLGINTGDLVRRQREDRAGPVEKSAWNQAARTWGLATRMGSAALTMAKSTAPLASAATRLGRRALGDDAVPDYEADLPKGSGLRRRPRRRDRDRRGVAMYFPSCLQTMFAPSEQGVFSAFNEVCRRAGVPVSLLDASDLCCGSPWRAKGFTDGYETMRAQVRAALAEHGEATVVVDAASCTDSLARMAEGLDLRVVDAVSFTVERLLPHLEVTRSLPSLVLHPTCASTRMDINDDLLSIATFIADEVTVPPSWACCGFAGDRGLLHPELTASATHDEAAEVKGGYFAYASLNRTCEIAMTRATGRTYVHILELLAQATR